MAGVGFWQKWWWQYFTQTALPPPVFLLYWNSSHLTEISIITIKTGTLFVKSYTAWSKIINNHQHNTWTNDQDYLNQEPRHIHNHKIKNFQAKYFSNKAAICNLTPLFMLPGTKQQNRQKQCESCKTSVCRRFCRKSQNFVVNVGSNHQPFIMMRVLLTFRWT